MKLAKCAHDHYYISTCNYPMLESDILLIQQFVNLLVRMEGFALIQTLASAQESIQDQLVKHVSNINGYSSDSIFIAIIWTWNLESQLLVHACIS